MKLLFACLVAVALLLQSGSASAAPPAAKSGREGQTWKINLKDAELRELVTQVANITGKTFVIDPRIKGKVTIISSAPLNRNGVYELFLSVLRVHGFAAIPAGDVIKIQQQTESKQSGSGPDHPGQIEDFVTRVIPAQYVDSNELVKILRPLIPQYGHLAAITTPNVVIISDHAENIERLIKLIQRIDVVESELVDVVKLKEAFVGNVVTLLERIAPEQVGAQAKGPQRVEVIANERTNSLVLRGKPRPIAQVKELIEQLDQPATASGGTEVIYLSHADAKEVADILKSLTSNSGNSGGSSIGPSLNIAPLPSNIGPGGGGGINRVSAGAAAAPRTASNIQADVSLNAIVVRGDPSQIAEVREIVAKLDVRRTQVLIEAAIVEISFDRGDMLGVDFAAIDASGGSVPFISTALSGSLATIFKALRPTATQLPAADTPVAALGAVSSPTIAVAKIDVNGVSFGAIIQALATSTNANLLSTPSILTLDNEEAKISVGQNVPFRTGSFTTDTNGANNPFTTIQRQDVGVSLKVTPHIHDGNEVRLEISQEVSSVAPVAAQGAAFSDIVTNKRTIETTIIADDGQTIVLGGLIQDDVTDIDRRVPLLGDIPYLGALFRNSSKTKNKRNLLVFLRPTVLRDASEVARVTEAKRGHLKESPDKPAPPIEELYEGRSRPKP